MLSPGPENRNMTHKKKIKTIAEFTMICRIYSKQKWGDNSINFLCSVRGHNAWQCSAAATKASWQEEGPHRCTITSGGHPKSWCDTQGCPNQHRKGINVNDSCTSLSSSWDALWGNYQVFTTNIPHRHHSPLQKLKSFLTATLFQMATAVLQAWWVFRNRKKACQEELLLKRRRFDQYCDDQTPSASRWAPMAHKVPQLCHPPGKTTCWIPLVGQAERSLPK